MAAARPPFSVQPGPGRDNVKGREQVARKFVGRFEQKVDGKGRVSIPASFRRVIETSDPAWTPGARPTLNIAYGEDGRPYLEGYSVEGLSEMHDQIDQLPPGSDAREVMEDLYYSCVQEFAVDDDGRIVLSKDLRDRIGIDGEALFLAKGNRFEIWAPEVHKTRRASRTREFLASQGEDFNPHALLAAAKGQG
ncbi:division/cell wall cluster transcriptional repressor MraZ [Allgaiera indica]|uniref:Transcriptional regulator MraZ n=1 Tax=Allgaiera indica TaxID=765699 RepID=A0A1H2ZMT6_9RHOB|nr:hypothetical protein [Allgaiera indica]SDX18039.1 MraZ protein [Allgaiera indica]